MEKTKTKTKTKTKAQTKETSGMCEQLISERIHGNYTLRLYITGTTNRSITAIANLKKICEAYLKGQYDLEVIDLYKNPNLAEVDQIIAAPTLIKEGPLPFRRIIGDMSNIEKVLAGLDLKDVE